MKKNIKNTSNKRKRSNVRYPGLEPALNRKNIRELLDFDYIKNLTKKEKDYLNQFCIEYYSADFRKTKKRIFKKKVERLKIGIQNNKRNQDAFSHLKSINMIDYNIPDSEINPQNTIDDIVDLKIKLKIK